jgi:hypothetical protein
MYLIPGLAFVEESLDYCERHLFHRPVVRVPHAMWQHERAGLVK